MDRLFGPMTPRHQRLTSMPLLEMFEQQSIQSFDYHDLSMQLKSIFDAHLVGSCNSPVVNATVTTFVTKNDIALTWISNIIGPIKSTYYGL